MQKVGLIAKREFLRTVKKRSFWLSTIVMPIFIVGVSIISGGSGQMAETMATEKTNNMDMILILDEARLISNAGLPENIVFVEDKEAGERSVKNKEASAFIYLPGDIILNGGGQIFTGETDLLSGDTLGSFVNQLIDSSIISSIEDQSKANLLRTDLTFEVQTITDKGASKFSLGNFIIPGIVVIIYILLISFGSSYLLLSVAEEKENRMIEIVISSITPRELIIGKLIGLLGVVITQILVLAGMTIGGLLLLGTSASLPTDIFSGIQISPMQIVTSVFYLLCGFLILANTMVGVGAAMPTYREAQSFSSVFILLGMYPLWLIMMIIMDPSGPIAMFSSYFPFSAAMVLLFRNALGELSTLEMIFSSVVLLVYVAVTFVISYKLFEIGALEYHQRLSLKTIIGKIRKK